MGQVTECLRVPDEPAYQIGHGYLIVFRQLDRSPILTLVHLDLYVYRPLQFFTHTLSSRIFNISFA